MRSLGIRFIVVGFLTLLMFIPLMMISDIVNARRAYSQTTIAEVGKEWGGAQTVSGPQVIIPVEETVLVTTKREVVDPATGQVRVHGESGQPVYELIEEERVERRAAVYLYPGRFDVNLTSETELRHRGIFQVPVYRAELVIDFDMPFDAAAGALTGDEVLLWDEAELRVGLSANRSLRGVAELVAGETAISLEPRTQGSGIMAALGDPRALGAFRLRLGLNGADSFFVAPVGRESQVSFASDWPDPSFSGAFLPDESEISETGFEARWTIPHLARALPQVSRDNHDEAARTQTAFGVKFYQPNDFYQKAWRASRYGILFIGLTFLTVLLIEGQRERPVHPVQYILIGLAQAIWTLLMLSYAEQIGFTAAYLVASGATIAVLAMFGAFGLKLGRRSLVLALMLVVLYGVLYLILQSTDFALIAGATLAFVALAVTMFATRNEEWYGAPAASGQGLLARLRTPPRPSGDDQQ